MNTMLNHIRYAIRQLSKSPGYAVTAVLTLALGIGALTTVVTWTNAVAYNPWPQVANQHSIRFVDATVLGSEGYSVHYDQFRFLRKQGHSFNDTVAFDLTRVNLASPNQQPRAIAVGAVTSNYFQFLGIQPEVGRFFLPVANERAYGAQDEVVLSDNLWHDRFAADPNIAGRTVEINHHVFTVIGVAPAGFAGIYGGLAEAAWLPLSAVRDLSSDSAPDPLLHYGLQVAVRLRPGVSDQSASAEIHTLAHSFALQQHDSRYNGWDLNLRDIAHFERGLFSTIGSVIPILFGASILLMLLVCINIASLLGQHAAQHRREVAIRTALGATPARIAAQVLAETGILALAGSLAGWAASLGISRALYVLLPNFGIPLVFNLQPDVRILSFVIVVTVLVTLACGMYPVRQSLRVSQKEALHEGGAAVAGGSRKKIGQRVLLGLQLGVCFIVLACCGLLTRTALNVVNLDTGFNPANTLTAGIDLSRSGYTKERGLAFQAAVLDKLRNSPDVAAATLTTHLPMGDSGSGNTQDFKIPGYVPSKGEEMEVVTDFEGPDFFGAMGIKMSAGRDFNVHDNASSPDVAIINEAMAQRYWPKGDAIGHSVVVDDKPRQIVGVIRKYAYSDPQNIDPDPVLYLPVAQHYESSVFLAVRSRTTASAVATEMRQAVASLDSSLPLENMQSLEEVVGMRYQFARIPAELLAVYAFCSVSVAMLGLYAVMAYAVIERKREFALRMALGSTRAAIFRLVLGGSAWTAAVGLLTGGLGSIAAVRLVRAALFGVAPFDPISFFAAAVLLVITVFVAGLAPARRAASIEPMQALRTE
ncbi:MAG: ABC transporter permease [Terracidiphilus sp.]